MTGVLFKENLPLFPDFVEFCRELGAQHVDLQVLARTFANAHASRDAFFEKHFWHTPEEKSEARGCSARFLTDARSGGQLSGQAPADLDWILRYVDDPDFTTDSPVCGSHHHEPDRRLARRRGALLQHPSHPGRPFVGNAASARSSSSGAARRRPPDRAVMDLSHAELRRAQLPPPEASAGDVGG